jgi:fibrillarin-like rRNA methylase
MVSKIMEFHVSKKIPLFVKIQEIIDHKNIYSIEYIVKTIDELTMYEKQIKNIKQQIIDATYSEIVSTLIEPLDEFFEEEYK